MAEFFLFILMVVAFCVWLHHKTGIFENLEIDNTPITHEDWEEELLDDPSIPGNPGYYDWMTDDN